MLTELADSLNTFIEQSKFYIMPWLFVLGGLWIVNFVNWFFFHSKLNVLGIYPRNLFGLVGIPFSPILHGDFNHLLFNSIPLFVLGLALLASGLDIFIWVTFIVTLIGGFAVWLFGRKALHIGASGLISGYFGYILVMAYLHPSYTTIILALLVLYYFGSIFLGIFPQEEKISWESHFLGFLAGIFAAFLPLPAPFVHWGQVLKFDNFVN